MKTGRGLQLGTSFRCEGKSGMSLRIDLWSDNTANLGITSSDGSLCGEVRLGPEQRCRLADALSGSVSDSVLKVEAARRRQASRVAAVLRLAETTDKALIIEALLTEGCDRQEILAAARKAGGHE